ncbi:hypothetical protein [Mycobacterium talmoniae]|uniref:Uncharacterized protein n=1 Tax=Mycobacterium talmoniae TaxID=1858794 RepID=A0A1S1NM52_9MYCO|nr:MULTISPECIES: hypothetical protein [Mycobacterium]OHV05061.1 hypothetical protein BKN37_07160 [Mycobacterium talmoniae]TDH55948.1 hypothetical protein E2F47_09545 [Mycobacterium eburneum]
MFIDSDKGDAAMVQPADPTTADIAESCAQIAEAAADLRKLVSDCAGLAARSGPPTGSEVGAPVLGDLQQRITAAMAAATGTIDNLTVLLAGGAPPPRAAAAPCGQHRVGWADESTDTVPMRKCMPV